MMGSKTKSIKPSEEEGFDRLSCLPEPLLSRILSLLPTKNAVSTSLLSKRWEFLWTSITNLKFDCDDSRLRYHEKTLDMRRKKFTQFVNRVLILLSPPCIQNFCLDCHHELCDPLDIHLWVCAAVRRTVQKLELHLVMTRSMELPLSHLHCKTLAVLKLMGDLHFKIAEAVTISFPNLHTLHLDKIEFTIANNCSIGFPSLKDLLLDCVRYTNEESVHKLFASCSALEILIIKRRDDDNAPNLIISIPSLIHLAICFWGFDYQCPSRIQIDTPALQYLSVYDNSMCHFTSVNLSSLLEATIVLVDPFYPADEDNYYSTIFKFVGDLFNAKLLSLGGHALFKVFSSISANIAPVFCNLTLLELNGYSCWCWSVALNNLLESMGNLEHLVFDSDEIHECEFGPWWMEPLRVPMCLLHRVTTISFTPMICGCSDELELVRYFLKNSKVLKMLTVGRIVGTDAEKYKLMQNLLLSPRGSQECQVDVEGERLSGYREGFYSRKQIRYVAH